MCACVRACVRVRVRVRVCPSLMPSFPLPFSPERGEADGTDHSSPAPPTCAGQPHQATHRVLHEGRRGKGIPNPSLLFFPSLATCNSLSPSSFLLPLFTPPLSLFSPSSSPSPPPLSSHSSSLLPLLSLLSSFSPPPLSSLLLVYPTSSFSFLSPFSGTCRHSSSRHAGVSHATTSPSSSPVFG